MILRKLFSVSRNAAVAQRQTMAESPLSQAVPGRRLMVDGETFLHAFAQTRRRLGPVTLVPLGELLQPRLSVLSSQPPGGPDRRFGLIALGLRQPFDDIAQLVSAAALHRNFAEDPPHRRPQGLRSIEHEEPVFPPSIRPARLCRSASLRRRRCSRWRHAAGPAHACSPDGPRPPRPARHGLRRSNHPRRSPADPAHRGRRVSTSSMLFSAASIVSWLTADFDTPTVPAIAPMTPA